MTLLNLALTFVLAFNPFIQVEGVKTADHPVSFKVARLYSSSVSLVVYDPKSKELSPPLCSGTILKHQKGKRLQILTAAHCLPLMMRKDYVLRAIKNQGSHNFEYEVRIAKLDLSLDLSLLESKEKMKRTGTHTLLSSLPPLIGESIWTVGSPNTVHKLLSRGVISQVFIRNKRKFYISDLPTFFGSSGGGIFNDNQEIIGVVQGLVGNKKFGPLIPGQTKCASLEAVRLFLEGE